MDKNTIIGFVLIALVLIGFSWYSQPSAEEMAEMARQDSVARVEQQKAVAAQKAAEKRQMQKLKESQADTTALFYSALKGDAQTITLENKDLALTLNSKGATVEKAVVKGYNDQAGNNQVTLFDGKEQQLYYTLEAKEMNISTKDLYFTPSNVSKSTVTFTAQAGDGKSVVVDYRLDDNYLLHTKIRIIGMEGLFSPHTNSMDVTWRELCRQQERGFSFENRYAMLTYHKSEGGTKHLSETSEKRETLDERIDWVGFKTQFFSTVMIAKNDFNEKAELSSVPMQKGSGYLKEYNARMKAFLDPTGEMPTEIDFYYGPNDFRKLQKAEEASTFGKKLQMQRLVYLGWPLFRLINRWFTLYVFDFLTQMNINMGIVLILITLLLKLITYPLMKKSYMSSAKMRVLKPKLDEATKQYDKPEDQMMKQQVMMQEYQKYGVNPMSGCLPMLIQMPVWIAMFNFVPNAIQLRGEKFLWINDLSTYDPIVSWGTDLWAIGDHISLTCILFCAAQIVYSLFTMRQQQDQMMVASKEAQQQMKMMKWMMIAMPLFFFFVFNDYSAGLNFYYFVSLFFSALIMFTLRHTTNDAKLLAILESRYQERKSQPQKKASGFAARLQAMQEQALEMQRQQMEQQKKKNN